MNIAIKAIEVELFLKWKAFLVRYLEITKHEIAR